MKKILAIVLALVMLFGVLPLTAYAQEADIAQEAAEEEFAATGGGLTLTNDLQDAYLGSSVYYSGVIPAFLSCSVTGGTGSYTYRWYYCGEDEYSSGDVVATTTAPVYEATEPGYYWCSIDDSAGNYTATGKARVRQTKMPDTEVRIWGKELYWKQSPVEEKLPDSAANGVRYSFRLTREDTTHHTIEEVKKIKLERKSSNNEIIGRISYGTVVYDSPVYDYDVVYDPDLKVYKLPLTQFIGTSPYTDIQYTFDFYSAVFKRSDFRSSSEAVSSNTFQSGYHTAEEYNKYGVNIPEDVYHYGEVQLMKDSYAVGSTITPNYKGGRWADCPEKVTPYVERLENDNWVEIAQTGSYKVTSADVGHMLRFRCKPNSTAYGQSYFVDEYFYSNSVSVPIPGQLECVFAKPRAGFAIENDITVLDSNSGKYFTLAKNTSSGTGLDWMCDDGGSRYVCNGYTCQGGKKYIAHVFFTIKNGYSIRAQDVPVYFNGERATVELQGTTTLHAYLEYDLPPVTEIDKVRVNVTAPQPGAAPSFTASPYNATGWKVNSSLSDDVYTNGVLWHNVTDNKYLTSASRFEKGKRYRVMVSLVTASERYLFADTDQITGVINQDYATVGCYAEATKRNNIYVEFTFDLDDVIRSVSVTVPEPVIGQKPVYSVDYPSGDKYTIDANMSLTWYEDGFTMKKTDLFRTGREYSVKFTVQAKDNYKFKSEPIVMVNGRPAVVENFNESRAWVEYTFAQGNTVSGSYTSYQEESDPINIFLMQGGSNKYGTSLTGNSGSYSIPNVANGDYYLTVTKHNHVTRQYQITVSGNLTQDVKICPLGDVDGNGKVQAADAMKAYQHAQGKSDAQLTGYAFKCADVAPVGNPNGKVQAADAMMIYQQAQGKHPLY